MKEIILILLLIVAIVFIYFNQLQLNEKLNSINLRYPLEGPIINRKWIELPDIETPKGKITLHIFMGIDKYQNFTTQQYYIAWPYDLKDSPNEKR